MYVRRLSMLRHYLYFMKGVSSASIGILSGDTVTTNAVLIDPSPIVYLLVPDNNHVPAIR